MRSRYLGALVAVMLVVGACGAPSQSTPTPAPASPDVSPPAGVSQPPPSTPSGATGEVTVGTDTGAELKFDPGEVTVQAGADVRLTFENRSTVPHNLTFQGPPNVATATIVAAGTTETLEFKAPDAGEYAFVCTLHPGMAGTLLVEGG